MCSGGIVAARLGLHGHASVLVQRGTSQLSWAEERLVHSGALDVDVAGEGDNKGAGVLEHVAAQYAAQSWLCMGPLANDRCVHE